MPARKRFNAFEDFSAPAETEQPQAPSKIAPPAVVADTAAQVERIERLTPSQMLPDRFQPRRLLPMNIRAAFFRGEISCYQAAERWLAQAQKDESVKNELDRLLALGGTFESVGQIKPITGSWVAGPDGSYKFQIETGERRFWAACLQKVHTGQSGEPLLRVEVVSRPTRQRQVIENRHAEPPTAVEQACEVAALILSELGIEPDPRSADDFDYFRLARAQRMPAGLWEKVLPVMQLTRPRMVQLLNILALPSHLLELADRHQVPERVLREVLNQPREQWEKALQSAIDMQLTAEDVAELAAAKNDPKPAGLREPRAPSDPVQLAIRGMRKFVTQLEELDEDSRSMALDEIADWMIISRQEDGILALLDELSVRVTARIKRR